MEGHLLSKSVLIKPLEELASRSVRLMQTKNIYEHIRQKNVRNQQGSNKKTYSRSHAVEVPPKKRKRNKRTPKPTIWNSKQLGAEILARFMCRRRLVGWTSLALETFITKPGILRSIFRRHYSDQINSEHGHFLNRKQGCEVHITIKWSTDQ
jgi:hypothetical protein